MIRRPLPPFGRLIMSECGGASASWSARQKVAAILLPIQANVC